MRLPLPLLQSSPSSDQERPGTTEARRGLRGHLRETGVKGFDRRQFLKICSAVAAMMGLSDLHVPRIAEAIEKASANKKERPSVVWLDFQECLGCTESFINAHEPGLAEIILDLISLDYHETLSAAGGILAEENRLKAIKKGGHVVIVEGAIATKIPEAIMVGGKTAIEIIKESASSAAFVIAVGECATYGGIQAAHPNPTGAKGVWEMIDRKKVVNIPGCPVNPEWLVDTLMRFLVFGRLPDLDKFNRPLTHFGQTIHDNCPRRAHFDEGRFVERFGTEEEARNYCLYKVGCKGPYTYSSCPLVLWNGRQNWCIGAGAPCIGCTEPDFWDRFAGYYEPLPGVRIPGFNGGVKVGADKIGVGVAGVAAAGIVAHGVGQVVKGMKARNNEEERGKGGSHGGH